MKPHDEHRIGPLPSVSSPGSVPGNLSVPPEVEGYEILQVLGEGGMGVVYLARQKQPVRRQVALKIVKPGMDSKQVITRFESERQALALLDHPNIAQVYDAGTTKDGHPYFSMEYVDGLSITEHCDQHKLSIEERLRLFIQVCEGVQHAHQKGIIHRDIKPSNILVSAENGKPLPKIIDFGVAKAITAQLTQRTLFTEQGQLIGTPEYMSPEQAEMTQQDVDTRSDIYSLGVVLYELLTGVLPFERKALEKIGFAEILRTIREEDPPVPSARLSSLGLDTSLIAEKRKTSPNLLSRQVRGDLDWIVMKSLEKHRTRRYATATDLAADIMRHLNSEPVQAHSPNLSYQLQRFLRRHRVSVTAGLLIAAALVTGLIIACVMYFQAQVALRQSQYWLYMSNIKAAQAVIEHSVALSAKDYLKRCPKEFRHWEWHRLNWLADRSIRTVRIYEGIVTCVTFGPDGKHILSIIENYKNGKTVIMVCNANTGEELVSLSGDRSDVPAISPDGKQIIMVGDDIGDKNIKVYDAATGAMKFSYDRQQAVGGMLHISSVAFSPDGQRIAAAGWSFGASDVRFYSIRVFDSSTGKTLVILSGHGEYIECVVFSPDGKRIVSGSRDKTIKLWDANTGEEILTLGGHKSLVFSVAFNPDAKRIVSGSRDKTIKLWDAHTGTELMTLRGHEGEVTDATFSPDGERIVSGSIDGTLKLWDAHTGEELMTFLGHKSPVLAVSFSPNGKHVVSGSPTGTIKVWDAHMDKEPLMLRGHEKSVTSLAFSPDSRRIVSSSYDKTIRVWDIDSGEELMILDGHKEAVRSVAFSPDHKRIVSGSSDKTIKIWDATTGDELKTFLGHELKVISVDLSPDGKRIVSADRRNIKIWDITTGTELMCNQEPDKRITITSVACSRDGQRLFSCSFRYIKAWDVETGEELFSILHNKGENIPRRPAMAICREGELILSTSTDSLTGENRITFWDASTGKDHRTLGGHIGSSPKMALSPDGERIASMGAVNAVTIWDAVTGEELINLGGHEGNITALAFSPDGQYIASADEGNTIRIWSCGPSDNGTHEDKAISISADARVLDLSHDSTTRPAAPGQQERGIITPSLVKKKILVRSKKLVSDGWKASWSPDGQRIAYGKGRGKGLWILELESGKTSNLTTAGKDPTWSPDGQYIAYIRELAHNLYQAEEVWLIKASGGKTRWLADGGFPEWSAHGTTLFMHSRTKNTLDMIDISDIEPDAKPFYDDLQSWYPAVSPDEKKIAFSKANALVIVDSETKRTVLTWSTPGCRGLLPAWSPDGSCIAFGGFDGIIALGSTNNNRFGLWVLDVKAREAVQVAEGPWTMPAWSRDGSKLAFDFRLGIQREIWMVEVEALETLKPSRPSTQLEERPTK